MRNNHVHNGCVMKIRLPAAQTIIINYCYFFAPITVVVNYVRRIIIFFKSC